LVASPFGQQQGLETSALLIRSMADMASNSSRKLILRTLVEIGFIIFLFYSNLLMGEFERSDQDGKTLTQGFLDIWTLHNFEIALVAAVAGFVVFEFLRRKLL